MKLLPYKNYASTKTFYGQFVFTLLHQSIFIPFLAVCSQKYKSLIHNENWAHCVRFSLVRLIIDYYINLPFQVSTQTFLLSFSDEVEVPIAYQISYPLG